LVVDFTCCVSSRTTFSLSDSPSDVDVVSSSDDIISSWDDIISSLICEARFTAKHSDSSSLEHTHTEIYI